MRKINEAKARTIIRQLLREEIDEDTGYDADDDLYYDTYNLAPEIMEWHGGQFTASYALGSSLDRSIVSS